MVRIFMVLGLNSRVKIPLKTHYSKLGHGEDHEVRLTNPWEVVAVLAGGVCVWVVKSQEETSKGF